MKDGQKSSSSSSSSSSDSAESYYTDTDVDSHSARARTRAGPRWRERSAPPPPPPSMIPVPMPIAPPLGFFGTTYSSNDFSAKGAGFVEECLELLDQVWAGDRTPDVRHVEADGSDAGRQGSERRSCDADWHLQVARDDQASRPPSEPQEAPHLREEADLHYSWPQGAPPPPARSVAEPGALAPGGCDVAPCEARRSCSDAMCVATCPAQGQAGLLGRRMCERSSSAFQCMAHSPTSAPMDSAGAARPSRPRAPRSAAAQEGPQQAVPEFVRPRPKTRQPRAAGLSSSPTSLKMAPGMPSAPVSGSNRDLARFLRSVASLIDRPKAPAAATIRIFEAPGQAKASAARRTSSRASDEI